ncbi:MAG TPA: trehalose-6-phosphate synthase [Stellaceae bacterium]|nr:trehalose-6-phosphate synthase [Stellaceae bacterium]
MSRLVLVSNRVMVPEPGASRRAGGLAVAVDAALKGREGLWFGWSGKVADEEDAPTRPSVVERRGRTYITLDLSKIDFQEYYNGFANRVLWPILHYRIDLAEFTSVDLAGYLRVNARFAETLSSYLQPDDIIWVHDYHLLTLAKELRALGHENPIGFFLHIPCPPPDLLTALPQHAETIGGLSHYDLVGLQTEADAENLGRYFETELGSNAANVRAFPVSIDTPVYARAARNAMRSRQVADLRASLAGRQLILGVDRLDYSKGIPHRIQAFGHLLDSRPEFLGQVTFLQITPRSRTDVPEYAEIEQSVSSLVGQINGRHGDPAWTPIRYVNRSFTRGILAGYYRTARVGLVTPLRDGMNLVAKEYVVAQDPEDPGVLILSQFAGAAAELEGALLVNPHEPEAVAEAIATALEMPLAERKARHESMFSHLTHNDIDRWADHFIAALESKRRHPGFLDGLRNLFSLRA